MPTLFFIRTSLVISYALRSSAVVLPAPLPSLPRLCLTRHTLHIKVSRIELALSHRVDFCKILRSMYFCYSSPHIFNNEIQPLVWGQPWNHIYRTFTPSISRPFRYQLDQSDHQGTADSRQYPTIPFDGNSKRLETVVMTSSAIIYISVVIHHFHVPLLYVWTKQHVHETCLAHIHWNL